MDHIGNKPTSSDDQPDDVPPTGTASELASHLESQINAGRLKPGDRLPPVREMAKTFAVAPNTASAAYRRLQERGLIFSSGRKGTFVAEQPNQATSGEQPVPSGLIDLAGGVPDPALLPDLVPALRAMTDRLDSAERGAAANGYGQAQVDESLAPILIADLQPDIAHIGVGSLKAGQSLAVVGGALDGIERVLSATLRPGDLVAVEDPGYQSVLNLVAAMNFRSIPVAVDDFGPIPDRLAQAATDGAKAVIITSRAQNPTGAAVDRPRAVELAGILAARPQLLIIEDDYAGPVAGVSFHSAIPAGAPRWAILRSVAKSLGPDLRLAALAGDETTVRNVTGRQLLGTGWVSHILQRTAAALLSDPAVLSQLDHAANCYRERREHFIANLANAGIPAIGRSGLNVWVPVSDEAEAVAGMQARGFAVRSGSRFRLNAAPAIRITTALADPEILAEAAAALVQILRGGVSVRSA